MLLDMLSATPLDLQNAKLLSMSLFMPMTVRLAMPPSGSYAITVSSPLAMPILLIWVMILVSYVYSMSFVISLTMQFALPGIGWINGSSIDYTIIYSMMFAKSVNTATVFNFLFYHMISSLGLISSWRAFLRRASSNDKC